MVALFPLIIVIILVVAAVWGYHKGFIAQIGAVGGLLLGVVACRLFGPAVMAVFPVADASESFPRHYLQLFAIYAGIYIAAYLAVVIVTKMMKILVGKLCLGPVDSLAGAVVGVLKWGIPLSLFLDLVGLLWPSSEMLASPVVEGVSGFAPWLLGLLSQSNL